MFQTVFPFIVRSLKLHIQRQVFVRPILIPAASLQAGYWVSFCGSEEGVCILAGVKISHFPPSADVKNG